MYKLKFQSDVYIPNSYDYPLNIYSAKIKNLIYTYDKYRKLLIITNSNNNYILIISFYDFKKILKFVNEYKYCAKENFYSVSCNINEKGNILIKYQKNFIEYIFYIDKNKAINTEFVVFEYKKLFCDILKDLIKIEEQV